MFFNKKHKAILRQPKIYTAPRDLEKKPLPKFIKILILFIIVVIALSYLFLFSPFFRIRNINLMGSPSSASIVYLDQFKGKNIFEINAHELENKLYQQNTEFLNVDVSLGIPNTLRVKFTERQPVLVWQTNNKNYLVDENAIVYKETEGSFEGLILVTDNKNIPVTLPSQIATSNFIDFLKNTKDKISKLGLTINKFEINETTFQVTAVTDKNIKIIFDTTRSITDQIDAAKITFDAKKDEIKEYMDVRVEGKVYYQ